MKIPVAVAVVGATLLCAAFPVTARQAHPAWAAPDFTLQTLQGDSLTLSSLRGRVVLLNIWSTSCSPCLQEMPDLSALHDSLNPHGITVVGLATDGENRSEVDRIAADLGITYPIVYGSIEVAQKVLTVEGDSIPKAHFAGASIALDLARMVPLPTTLIIDRQGIITDRIVGIMPKDELIGLAQALQRP